MSISFSYKGFSKFASFSLNEAQGALYNFLVYDCESKGLFLSQHGLHSGLNGSLSGHVYIEEKNALSLFDTTKIQLIFSFVSIWFKPALFSTMSFAQLKPKIEQLVGQPLLNGEIIAAMFMSGFTGHFSKDKDNQFHCVDFKVKPH